MKVTQEKAAEHRAAIVRSAGRLFRLRGFDNVGVAEITRDAGLTHGVFYGHFASKDALAAEACTQSFAESLNRLPEEVVQFVDNYLSDRHRDRADGGCPIAAFAPLVRHEAKTVQASFGEGFAAYVEAIAQRLANKSGKPPRKRDRARAIAILSSLVGAMALARATRAADPDLSEEILVATRKAMSQGGDAPFA